MKKVLAIALVMASTLVNAEGDAALENPADSRTQSGISTISGWVCDASEVTIVIDDKPPKIAAYGTTRRDTINKCGHEYTGFGLLWNWNLTGSGEHRIRAYADGVKFADRKFYVGTPSNELFLTGASKQYVIRGFPYDNTEVGVVWNESSQNFAIVENQLLGEIILPDTGKYDSWVGWWWSEDYPDLIYQITPYYGNGVELLLMVEIDDSKGEMLSAAIGEVSGNTTKVSYVASVLDNTIISNLTLVSQTRMRLDIVSCLPDQNCPFKTGNSYYFIDTFQEEINSNNK